tara:strand:- start:1432 stop:2316 length:885 start_codon:yes stop_codon:yes gene_type:complete
MDNSQVLFSHRNAEPEQSVLYIVGTPIGNLDDISFRAKRILQNVALIACEDTRVTKKLLNHLKISNKLVSFNSHNSLQKSKFIISKLKEGESIALVSDAGMPLISDPGENLVDLVKKKNFDVICIPGPCALIAGLVSSGLSTSKFTFFGFVPKTKKNRKDILEKVSINLFSSVLYESPKRILKLLLDLKIYCGGERKIVLLKEITKKYENHFGGSIDNVIKLIKDIEIRGEFTIIIEGRCLKEDDMESNLNLLKNDLINLMKAGLSHSAASNYLSKKTGFSRNKIYKLIVKKDL